MDPHNLYTTVNELSSLLKEVADRTKTRCENNAYFPLNRSIVLEEEIHSALFEFSYDLPRFLMYDQVINYTLIPTQLDYTSTVRDNCIGIEIKYRYYPEAQIPYDNSDIMEMVCQFAIDSNGQLNVNITNNPFYDEDNPSLQLNSGNNNHLSIENQYDKGSLDVMSDGYFSDDDYVPGFLNLPDSEEGDTDINWYQNGIDGATTISGAIGTFSGFKGNSTHNELYWKAKNGKFYSTSKLSKPGGYARSYKLANSSLKTAKAWSNRMAGVGIAVTAADVLINQEVEASDAVNAFMAGISFTGIGSIVAGTYFITDMSFELFTGTSLGERIDNLAGGPIYNWE